MNDQDFNNSYRPPVDVFEDNYGNGSNGSGDNGYRHGGFDLRAALSSGLFLAICVLSTVALFFNSFDFDFSQGISTGSIDVFGIISTVGLWITYASARDRKGEINPTGATMVSGCIKAQRILIWVLIGIVAAFGILCIVAGAVIQAVPELSDTITENFSDYVRLTGSEYLDELIATVEELIANGFVMLLFIGIGIGMLITAIIMLIFNLTYYKSCHRLARSVAEMIKGRTDTLVCTRAVSVWLMVLGIFSAVTAAFDISAALTAAELIVCSVFIRQLGE